MLYQRYNVDLLEILEEVGKSAMAYMDDMIIVTAKICSI